MRVAGAAEGDEVAVRVALSVRPAWTKPPQQQGFVPDAQVSAKRGTFEPYG